MRVTQHQRSFTTALAISVVSHTAAISLLSVARNVDDPSLPSRALEVVLMPQPPAATVQPPSPEKLERRTSRELSRKSQQEPKVESAPKSMPEPGSKPLLAPAKAPVADASPITQQPTAEAPTTPPESKSPAAAAPAALQAAETDSAFPGHAEDGIIGLPARVTYYDLHKNDPVTVTGPVFPGHAEDAGIYLPARVTYYDLHKNDPVTVTGPVFPGHADDAGIYLPARVTYADLVGKKKADEACAACHGPEGSKPTTPETPRLAGLQQDYLVQALIEYRKGTRDNAVMTAIAKPLTEREIRDLAWYFSRRR